MGEGHSNVSGHGSRGPTGGVKGGATGFGGGNPNSGNGWGVSQTPYGPIHNYNPSKFGHGSQGGGNRGGNRGNKATAANLAQNPELQAYMAVGGMPAVITLMDGSWGVTLSRLPAVAAYVEGHLARVGSWLMRSSPVGVAVLGMMPSSIAPDPPMGQFFTTPTLPADRVTNIPKETLKTVTDVAVNIRVRDVTEDGVQKAFLIKAPIAIQQVPVIKAVTTTRPSVFIAAVPGITPIHIRVTDTITPIDVSAVKQLAVKPNINPIENADFKEVNTSVGRNTHDAIIVFPDSTDIEPLYLSVIRITNNDELMQEARSTYEIARSEREAAERDVAKPIHSVLGALKLKKTLLEKQVTETVVHITLLESNITLLKQAEAQQWQQREALRWHNGRQTCMHKNKRRELEVSALAKQGEVNTLNQGIAELKAKYETLLMLQRDLDVVKAAEQKRIEDIRLAAEAAERQRVEDARLAAERQRIENTRLMAKIEQKFVEFEQWVAEVREMQRIKDAFRAAGGAESQNKRPIAEAVSNIDKQSAIISRNTFFFPAHPIGSLPLPGFAAGGMGSVTLIPQVAAQLSASLRRVSRRFRKFDTTLSANPLVVIIGAGSSLADDGAVSEQPLLAGSFPLSDIGLSLGTRLSWQAEVDSPVRILMASNDGRTSVYAVKTDTVNVATKVKTGEAQFDKSKGVYIFTSDSQPPRTFIFTPAQPPGLETGSILPPPASVPVFPQHTGTDIQFVAVKPDMIFLAPEESDFHDYIIWFPADSGLEPVYVYLKTPRDVPGIVTGHGQRISGIWLAEAGKGQGAPIPAQIADKLRGRKFSNFDRFREAFWQEVANDPELSGQFKFGNLGNIKNGKAPSPRESEQVGSRVKYELHHVKPISKDGAVYDIDNIRVLTPKKHIEIHKEVK
ncbi:S-type pyocin domain-containing protein [Yersinia enterocolitica]|uniref:S-type pyocin domain-containing protein n=1 Tax=Yersinia enterocolitica TaxID=630 RepID=UPI000D98EBBA|nr:S-type pyocin domain-containing protein [Yersinia enterocolitica]SQA33514.1 colicin/pyocin immunity family protein [Yersinia enterocolitica]SUP65227.1 colicin/pyocin immunity family protein [Yersinia enterocolitica]HDM8274106.1 S-type pyocin domain-containing protein [Yersinia enterocolitica]HED5566372.1 S-type pyocin domain-containing protein [Yersinia enterocolitica]